MTHTSSIIYTIYDLLTGKTIDFYRGSLAQQCKTLGLHYTQLPHLQNGRYKSINGRYILPSNKHLIFILVDYETQQEYECFNNVTIFLHLNMPYNDNESKYIYEVKSGRQKMATINGKVFYLKGNREKITFDAHVKAKIGPVSIRRNKAKLYKRIKSVLNGRIRHAMLKQLLIKNNLTLDLVGCDVSYFCQYLERQFSDGMSWNNYGMGKNKWNVDHIIPCSFFDLFNEEARYKAFHYMNCRPCWANKNSSKNDSITPEAISLIKKDYDYLGYIKEPYKTQINNYLNQ